jgi:hypothetical protein
VPGAASGRATVPLPDPGAPSTLMIICQRLAGQARQRGAPDAGQDRVLDREAQPDAAYQRQLIALQRSRRDVAAAATARKRLELQIAELEGQADQPPPCRRQRDLVVASAGVAFRSSCDLPLDPALVSAVVVELGRRRQITIGD